MVKENKELGIEKLYTKRCAASILKVSTCTVDRLRKAGELRSLQIGGQVRIKESEIERFIEEAGLCRK